MVTLNALDLKMWRDLWHLRGQAFAIAAVMASGVACFIMFLTTLDSLHLSRELYYRDYRFAEVFAPLKRAPESVQRRIAEIDGVDMVDTRVIAPVTIDIEGFSEPVTGVITSIPDSGEPLLNNLYLRPGGWLKREEVMRSLSASPLPRPMVLNRATNCMSSSAASVNSCVSSARVVHRNMSINCVPVALFPILNTSVSCGWHVPRCHTPMTWKARLIILCWPFPEMPKHRILLTGLMTSCAPMVAAVPISVTTSSRTVFFPRKSINWKISLAFFRLSFSAWPLFC